MSSNLPEWPGADESYRRAQIINSALCARAWDAALVSAKGNRKQAYKIYSVPEDSQTLIDAMNAGDEETIKALNHQYRDLWLPTAHFVDVSTISEYDIDQKLSNTIRCF